MREVWRALHHRVHTKRSGSYRIDVRWFNTSDVNNTAFSYRSYVPKLLELREGGPFLRRCRHAVRIKGKESGQLRLAAFFLWRFHTEGSISPSRLQSQEFSLGRGRSRRWRHGHHFITSE